MINERTKGRFVKLGLGLVMAFVIAVGGCGGSNSGGKSPALEVDPATIDFGAVRQGEPITRDVTLRNVGKNDLTITRLVVEEHDDTHELSVEPTGEVELVIAPQAEEVVTVTLAPSDDQADTGMLQIESNDPAQPTVTVPITSELAADPTVGLCGLSGDGSAPWDTPPFTAGCDTAADDSPQVDFDLVEYGQPATKVLAVYNTGDGAVPLGIESIALADISGDATHLTLSYFVLRAEDSTPAATTLPVSLRSADASAVDLADVLYVQLDFDANVESFPEDELEITTDLSADPIRTVAVVGRVSGCPEGYWDLNEDPSDGCEYECDFIQSTEDCLTEGVDDDCDGETDDEDADNCTEYYIDGDDDGVGDGTTARCLCGAEGDHVVTLAGDCNDADPDVGNCSMLPGVENASCVQGACVVDSCAAGFANCDDDDSDGCEIDLNDPTTCGTNCSDWVNCTEIASTDSDGAADAYETGGTVTDYAGCNQGGCSTTTYADSCNGTVLSEYGADGTGVSGPVQYDCTENESLRCEGPRYLWRNAWDCSGTPGACVDVSDVIEQDCGTDGCEGTCGSDMNGCMYHDRGCYTLFPSGAECADTALDCDGDTSYCSACGQAWNIGGEVDAVTCCGDDAGEHARDCTDSSTDGNCGSSGASRDACCDAATDCVDHQGSCRTAGSCATFGSGGKKSYCGNGTWQSPDEASSYCEATGCNYSWMTISDTCCGDDPGEDHEENGLNFAPCCYNAAQLNHQNAQGAILCDDGELYNCHNGASDHSGLAENRNVNTWVGQTSTTNSHWCTANDTWCPWGTTDCDASPGCEVTLNSNPSCSNANNLGFWCAEVVWGSPPSCSWYPCGLKHQQDGQGEAWFRWFADICSSCSPNGVGVKVELWPTSHADYDIYLYDSCGGSVLASSTSGGMGGYEMLTFNINTTTHFFIEVRFKGGTSCADWHIAIYGHDCD